MGQIHSLYRKKWLVWLLQVVSGTLYKSSVAKNKETERFELPSASPADLNKEASEASITRW